MTNREPEIGSGAVVTACDILGDLSHTDLGGLLVEYLPDFSLRVGTKSKTLLSLKEFATSNRQYRVQTDFGEKPLAVVLVEEAIRRVGLSEQTKERFERLERYLNLDGYALLREVTEDWGEEKVEITGLTVAMPQFAELPETSSEVEVLLARHGFEVAEGHLTSAKDNIAQGDWVAANSQCRTFLEALTNTIADTLYPSESLAKSNALQKRQLLANKGFLSRDKREFGDGNKQAFLPGLANLLHPDGSHPGISTPHDAMFRLQVVIVTARWLLKRFESTMNEGRRA